MGSHFYPMRDSCFFHSGINVFGVQFCDSLSWSILNKFYNLVWALFIPLNWNSGYQFTVQKLVFQDFEVCKSVISLHCMHIIKNSQVFGCVLHLLLYGSIDYGVQYLYAFISNFDHSLRANDGFAFAALFSDPVGTLNAK